MKCGERKQSEMPAIKHSEMKCEAMDAADRKQIDVQVGEQPDKQPDKTPFGLSEDGLRGIIGRHSTPLYIFDEDEFLSRFDYFHRHLGADIGLTFCMKTNPFLTAVSLARAERIEVCSDGEFRICRDLRIPPNRLLLSGVLKSKPCLREAIRYAGNQAIYTAESEAQLRLLDQLGREAGMTLPVLLRLTSGNQFGMDEAAILRLLRLKTNFPNTEISGIHFFSGTQKHRLSKHRKELEKLDAFFRVLEEEVDFHVPMLEYGTGFGVPYFDGQEENVTSPASLQEFRGLLDSMTWKGKVTLEMGRALAYSCGAYITRVCDVKSNEGKNYVIVDGGIHQLQYDGQIRGMYQPEIKRLPAHRSESKEQHYVICGSLCTVNDVIVADYVSPEIYSGDYLIFGRAGAYSIYEGMSLFLSHELPGVLLYSKRDGFRKVRGRLETYPLNTPGLLHRNGTGIP